MFKFENTSTLCVRDAILHKSIHTLAGKNKTPQT